MCSTVQEQITTCGQNAIVKIGERTNIRPQKRHDWSRGGGGGLSKCSKTLYYKNLLETYFVKPVGKYQFAMACIRALVMSAYKVINCLNSQPKHMFWVLKRTVSMRRFF